MASSPTPGSSDVPSGLGLLNLANVQSLFRAALALGTVPPEKEVETRSRLGDLLIREYEQGSQRNEQHLRDAIEHSEGILRRLPRNSPERPQHLNRLSYARLSEYMASRSWRAIDEAVRCGRLARREAIAAGLPEKDVGLYFEILNNLGIALSRRCQNDETSSASATTDGETEGSGGSSGRSAAVADLDEAIDCARESKARSPSGSEGYLVTLLDLASRLNARYLCRGDPADHLEAVELLRELQLISPPGSVKSGLATMQFGQMAVDKFKKTNILEDLDGALRHIKEGVAVLPEGSELRPQILNLVAALYSNRHQKTNDVTDLRNAVSFSIMALEATPVSHGVRGGYLAQHMRLLRVFANATVSVQEVNEVALKAHWHLINMLHEYRERHDCRTLYSDVLGRKYILSRKLEDLDEAVHHIVKLFGAPPGRARDAGAEYLYDQIATACKSHDFVHWILSVKKEFVTLVGVYADAAWSEEAITEEDAQKKAKEIELNEKTKLEDRLSRPRWKPMDYKTELGQRRLAMDPTDKRIILDMSGLMTGIFGYDTSESISQTEFAARYGRLEKESVERARADGKHPNQKLCHMCRLVKPLGRTTEKANGPLGFEWKCCYLPFGNWHQLKLRQHCSICRLVLSLIVTNPIMNTLHPRHTAIDPEIQGVQLSVGEVQASGEAVLTVEYGMQKVGELRMVTESNYTTALRQGWEAREQHREFQDFVGGANIQEGQADGNDGPLYSTTGQQACNSSCCYHSERYDADIPLVFIDVIDNCLLPATSAVKYFALSYVWGAADTSPTLLTNYKSRCQKGGLPQRLPNTITDAIALVRALHERYLWVDALCIVQDDPEHKMRHIARMDIIYVKAFATVVALRGASADAGLPGVRPGTRSPQQVETLVVDAGSKDLDCNPHPDPESAEGEEKITLHLVATPPPLHLALETSRWDTRGWTFQERLLSRQCLYFADRYVYFQCGRWCDMVLSECGLNGPLRAKQGFWDDHRGKMSARTSLDNPLFDLRRDGLTDLAPEPRRAKVFAAYAKLVEKYTTRKLSYDDDIINAFLGTFAALNTSFQSDTLCGLPAAALDLAMLWAPAGRLPRRRRTPATPDRKNMEGRPTLGQMLPTNKGTVELVWGPPQVKTFDETVDRRFPSWSWAGWKGPVEYRLFAEMLPNEPLPTSLIKEFAINLDGKELQTIPGRKQQRVAPSLKGGHSTSVAPEDDASMANLNQNGAGAENKPITSPSLPNILQFLASTVPFSAFTISTQREYISVNGHSHSSSQQGVRHILDRKGKRCGLWWEQAGYVYVGRGTSTDAESKMILVGVSRHEDTFSARNGPYRVEGRIKLFDDEVYPAVGKGSGLVNVLAVDLDIGHEFGERITVARIHARAWEEARPVMRMIRLA
ncbi:hypothetical protein DL769_011176 [Monosporascus sp. CRB-8-3]|nr:hypothetical protein DL769_011176 [Monosporascus sp. CRB-8-3]